MSIATAIAWGCLTGVVLLLGALVARSIRRARAHGRRNAEYGQLRAEALKAEWDDWCDSAGIPEAGGDQLAQLTREIREHDQEGDR